MESRNPAIEIKTDARTTSLENHLTATYHWTANNLWIDSHVGQPLFVVQHSTVKIQNIERFPQCHSCVLTRKYRARKAHASYTST